MPVTLEHHEVTKAVRARRQGFLAALSRAQAPQQLGRDVSLSALALAAIWAAIFTALAVKEVIRGDFVFHKVAGQTWDFLPFVFLVTALLFARSRLYASREERPGLAAIVACLFQVAGVSLVFALVN